MPSARRFVSGFFLLIVLPFVVAIAMHLADRNGSGEARELAGLTAKAISVTVSAAGSRASSGVIRGPIFVDSTFLHRALQEQSLSSHAQSEFVEALKAEYESASPPGAQNPIVLSKYEGVVSEERLDGKEKLSVAQAGVLLELRALELKGASAELALRARFNDQQSASGIWGMGVIHASVSLLRSGETWRVESVETPNVVY